MAKWYQNLFLNVVDNWNVDETLEHAARRCKKAEKVEKNLKRILVESEERYTWMKDILEDNAKEENIFSATSRKVNTGKARQV